MPAATVPGAAAVQAIPPPQPRRRPTASEISAAEADLQQHPSDAARYAHLGDLYVDYGRVPEGVLMLRRAAALDPRAEQPFRSLARVYQELRYLDWEIEALEHLAKLQTRDAVVYLRLGEIYLDLGWSRRAKPYLFRAEELAPNSPDPQYQLALYQFRHYENGAGIDRLLKSNARFPDDLRTTLELVPSLVSLNRYPEAERIARDALRRQPANVKLQKLLAYVLVSQGKPDRAQEAVPLLQVLERSQPNDPEPPCRLGRAYEILGRPADAETAYAAACRISPAFENAAFALSKYYNRSGRTEEGRRLMETYSRLLKNTSAFGAAKERLETSYNDPQAYVGVAEWYTRTNDYPRAIAELKEALARQPKSDAIRGKLRAALIAAGRKSEATRLG